MESARISEPVGKPQRQSKDQYRSKEMGECQKVAWLVMPKWPKVKLRRGLKGPLSSLKFMGQN